jgi:hypothetical protein
MSIVRACIRLATVAALRDRLWPADILDSDNRPLEEAVTQEPRPYVVVFTDDDDYEDIAGNEVTAAARSLLLVIEFGIAAPIPRNDDKGPHVEIPATDGTFELVLDSLDRQIMNALVHDSASPFGEHWRRLIGRVLRLNGKRGGSAEKGARWAVRQRIFHVEPLIDPVPGATPLAASHPIMTFLDAAEHARADLDIAAAVPLLRAMLEAAPASSWRLAQQWLGARQEAIRGIGLAPPDAVLADDKEAPGLARINALPESTIVKPGPATVEGIP